jgi:cell wall-associated NlpC family hydrolase
MADNLDRRITPARPDLAAAYLQGSVDAQRFSRGEKRMSLRGHTPLRARPESYAPQETEILCGETFTVYEQKDGWAWGQLESDDYVGYVHCLSLEAPVAPTHRVSALATPVLTRCDVKAAATRLLPMNALVRAEKAMGDFIQTNAGFVHARHLVPVGETESDFVAVAERFVGAPYVWGGKTYVGLDCSGLIQTSLQATGKAAPRDADMQEKALGAAVPGATQRGDMVFWKGHVGVMLDDTRLLHANAFHMIATIEPLAEAVARISTPVTSIRRL